MITDRAYITILSTNTYINGVVVLYYSLMNTNTEYPLYCIVTEDINEENIRVLKNLGIKIIRRQQIIPNQMTDRDGSAGAIKDTYGWHYALVKLEIFNLTQFKKIVYIDCDVIILQNMDELFQKPHMTALRDNSNFRNRHNNNIFCSGLLVVEPNMYIYKDILQFFKKQCEELGNKELIHDQLILQKYYSSWRDLSEKLALDTEYNAWTTYFEESDLYYPKYNVKSIHIIDVKPWNKDKQYFINYMQNYPAYAKLCLWYIDVLNWTIKDLNNKGITSSDLKIIE